MSRIDITIKEIATDNLIVNRGFCRDTHLEIYCEHFEEEIMCDFANDLYSGVSLGMSNFQDFLFRLSYVIQVLSNMDKEDQLKAFPSYPVNLLEQFINDLEDSFEFLRLFKLNEKDISKFNISII